MTLYAPFIDGFGKSPSINFQLDNTLNMYVETAVMDAAESRKAIIGAPGTSFFLDLGDGPIRGQCSIEGYDFIVAGNNVWQKNADDSVILLGTVANDNLPVKMVSDATQIFLRSAGIGYQIRGFNPVLPVPAPPWTSLADVAFLHGYFIGLDDDGTPTGGQFFLSALNDCLTWDPLDFSNAPASGNKLRALATSHDELYVFGSVVIQPFYDSGAADFPIVPNQSGTMETGTIAKDSVCGLAAGPDTNDNVLYFLSETVNGHAQAIKLNGYSPARVSTDSLEAIWQTYSDISNCNVFTFQERGHQFVQYNFAAASWRYDSTTDKWAQVGWLNQATGLQETHRAANHGFNLGRHLVGDRQAGIIWQLSSTVYSDGDPVDTSLTVPQVSIRECLLPSKGTFLMFISRIELLGETGVGDGSGVAPGDDPQVGLERSGNAGHSYLPVIQNVSMGKLGEYNKRMVWTTCGSFRMPAIRISTDAPVKRCWYGLDIQIQEGIS